MLTWDVSISQDNDTSVFYFGVGKGGLLQRWHFQVDMENNTVTLIDYYFKSVGNLGGGNYTTSILSNIYYCVACADCGSPGVAIYSQETFDLVQSFNVTQSQSDPINLAVYADTRFAMQLFIGTR